MLSYVGTELHATVRPLFDPSLPQAVKSYIQNTYKKKLSYLNETLLKEKEFCVGDRFTIADAFLMVILGWTSYTGLRMEDYPNIKSYYEHMRRQPGDRPNRILPYLAR